MYRDLKYIIKRVIIGVLIALALMFLRKYIFINVKAETLSDNIPLTYASLSSSGYGSNSSSSLPLYQSYSNFASTTFYNNGNVIMSSGNSYYLYYVVEMAAKNLILPNGVQCFVQTTGGSVIRAIPDREEYLYLYNTGTNTFTIAYMFGLDVTVNINTVSFQFDFSSTFDSSFYTPGLTSATFTVVNPGSSGGGSSGGGSSGTTIIDFQPVIMNQIQNTQSIINNQNNNTEDIIDNQNSNTQDIIDNQNQNTDKQIDSQKVCISYDINNILINNRYLNSDGSLSTNTNYGISDYLNIQDSEIKIINRFNNSSRYFCWYDNKKNLISCSASNTLQDNTSLTIPNNAYFVRFTFYKSSNVPFFNICSNGNQALNDFLTDDNTNKATNDASGFFSNFQSNSHGLSGIISSPLRLIQSFSNSTCTSLVLPLPFVQQNATLPCMSTIYSQFPTFYNLWQLITTGLIAYWIVVRLFGKIHDLQNPNNDRIEVLNL